MSRAEAPLIYTVRTPGDFMKLICPRRCGRRFQRMLSAASPQDVLPTVQAKLHALADKTSLPNCAARTPEHNESALSELFQRQLVTGPD